MPLITLSEFCFTGCVSHLCESYESRVMPDSLCSRMILGLSQHCQMEFTFIEVNVEKSHVTGKPSVEL